MARKYRSKPTGLRAGSLIMVLGILLFACIAGMGYVWHRNRNEQLGRQIRETSARLEASRSANFVLDQQLEGLKSPRVLEAAVQRLNLGLVMPQPEQILRIPEGQPGAAIIWPQTVRLAARRPAAGPSASKKQ